MAIIVLPLLVPAVIRPKSMSEIQSSMWIAKNSTNVLFARKLSANRVFFFGHSKLKYIYLYHLFLGNLKAHINTHTGFKPYCCQVCMRAFAQKSNLNYHMKSAHNPNRPFKCDSCEKSFKTKEELTRHIENKHDVVTEISDDGIKLVKYPKKGRASTKKLHGCPYCGKCFGQSFNLKLHINTHTGKPF